VKENVIDNEKIDRRVRGLVKVLNKIPGVTTSVSCGGHTDPNACQAPEGHFYVRFTMRPFQKAQRALAIISHAGYLATLTSRRRHNSHPTIILSVNIMKINDITKANPRALGFELRGGHVSPARIAEGIEQLLL